MLPLVFVATLSVVRLALMTGESRDVPLPAGTDLSVSRRGVVDVLHVGDGHWQFTGLHAGFVIIDAKSEADGSVLRRVMVDVTPNENRGNPSGPPPSRNPDVGLIPEWICKGPEVACDQDSGLVTGTAPSLLWLRQAKSACDSAPPCYLAVHLSAIDRLSLVGHVAAALPKTYEVSAVTGGDRLVATTYCGKTNIRALSDAVDFAADGLVALGLLAVQCRDEPAAARERYRLSARLYLMVDAAFRQLGFDSNAQFALKALPYAQGGSIAARLEALAERREAQVVGAPALRLAPGSEARLATGGEFQTESDEESPGEKHTRTTWKQHGLQLAATVTPLDALHARTTLDVSLKARSGGTGNALTVNSLKTDADLTLGEPVAIGAMDFANAEERDRDTPLLAKIPVIGPLFHLAARDNARTRLVLWVRLDREPEAKGEIPPVNIPPSPFRATVQ